MDNPSLEEIAQVLDNAKILSSGVLRAGCPAHGGVDRNLKVSYEGDKLLATCHSQHCSFEAIMQAIRSRLDPAKYDEDTAEITHKGAPITTLSDKRKKAKDETVKKRTTWDIRDESGKLIAIHVRDDFANAPKEVKWRLPNGQWGLGGKSTAALPLYGAQEVARAHPGAWVVVTEGEKACDALKGSLNGIIPVGTVTGAGSVPSGESLAVLRGKRVVLWPDNDDEGRAHMAQIADELRGVAQEIRLYVWEDAPAKGDAADLAPIAPEMYENLSLTLKLAPRYANPPPIPGREFVGEAIERGVEPPEELLPDILLANKAHNIFSAGGVGKTWVLVWIATQLVARGKKVVVFDLENGLRTYAERFEEMGADPKLLDELLYYYPFPAFDRDSYAKMLDEVRPDIVMFDSWIGFLSADGLEESENKDIAAWADRYSKPALRRGAAVTVLDHVPHEHERERGASRKRDEMDVVWRLTKVGDFDREQTATLNMTRQKDREGWLPEKISFEVGGDPTGEGFIMRRDDSLSMKVEVTHLTSGERKALAALRNFKESATTAEWLEELQKEDAEIKKGKLHHLRRALVRKDKVKELGGKYQAIEVESVSFDEGGIQGVQEGLIRTPEHPQNQGAPGGVRGIHPPKGGCNTPPNTPTTASPLPQEEKDSEYPEEGGFVDDDG